MKIITFQACVAYIIKACYSKGLLVYTVNSKSERVVIGITCAVEKAYFFFAHCTAHNYRCIFVELTAVVDDSDTAVLQFGGRSSWLCEHQGQRGGPNFTVSEGGGYQT